MLQLDLVNRAKEATPSTFKKFLAEVHPGNDYDIVTSSQLTQSDIKECLALLIDNVKNYDASSTMDWDLDEKRDDISNRDSRLIIFRDRGQGQVQGDIIAFLLFRFDTEECINKADSGECTVIYCYEIHVHKEHQGKGLGRRMLTMMETLGDHFEMDKAMLTTFKNNKAAAQFYEKMGYSEDNISPGVVLKDDPQVAAEYDYSILSKLCRNHKL